jgi:hypothetical protein
MLVGEQAARPRLGQDARKEGLGNAPAKSRSRFFVNTVGSQTASSLFSPTNQRKSRL